jgi:hypothetical protein
MGTVSSTRNQAAKKAGMIAALRTKTLIVAHTADWIGPATILYETL